MAEWKKRENMRVLGKPHPRLDGPGKVTGAAKYAYDINLPGLLHGRIIRCPHAHAVIESIDTSAAEKLPGVKAVIMTAQAPRKDDKGNTVEDRMLYAGQEVGAVAATTMGLVDVVDAAFKASETKIPSRSDIRRLIQQGGVQLDGQKLTDPLQQVELKDGQVLRIGKRTVVKVQLRT